MPYIKKEARYLLTPQDIDPEGVGELNYCITLMCKNYLEDKGKSYETINSIIGVLECAKQEFYRRIAAPYEDIKIEENGDVYD